VRSHRIDGNLVLLEMEISINLTSLTIEAVIHKRKKLLRDLCEQIQGCFSTELATALHWRTQREGWRALGFAVGAVDDARLVDLLKVGLEHVARHEDAYYNDDAQLGEAIRAAVFTKSGLLITAALAQPTVLQGAEKLHLALSGKEPFHLVGDKRIHLFKKGLGDGGMHLLAVVVLASTALQALLLQENGFTAVGAGWLAEALRRSSSLTELVLGGNPLGDAGIAAIADALKVNRSLRILNVNNAGFGEDGAKTLLETLRVNESLTTLSMKKTLDEESAAAFRASVQRLERATPLELLLE